MKFKNLFFALFCSTCLFTACSDDDDEAVNNDNAQQNVPADVLNSFQKMYGNVKDVAWEKVSNYHVAHFNAPISRGRDYTSSAWFTQDGTHCQSDEEVDFIRLPKAVQDGFNAYKQLTYANWEVDDCEKVLREGMEMIYVIEIESGDQEREISVSEQGDILKDVVDTDDDEYNNILPVIVPNELKTALQALYPDTYSQLTILEIENDGNEIEVDIKESNMHKEVKFTRSYQWVSTEYDVTMTQAISLMKPEVANKLIAFAKSNGIDLMSPAIQQAIEIEVKETAAQGRIFEIEVELGGQEIKLIVDEEGRINGKEIPDVDNNDSKVPEAAKNTFKEMYGDIEDVKWETVKEYYVARFNAPITKAGEKKYTSSAWFSKEGAYCQSEEDVNINKIPAAVKAGFDAYKQLHYADWTLDECEMVSRKGMGLIYVFEIEKGQEEREISVSEQGDILKDVLDVDDDSDDNEYNDILPVVVPEGLENALKTVFPENYDKISILEVEVEVNEIEVDVLEKVSDTKSVHKEVKFTKDLKWVSTEYDATMEEAIALMGETVSQRLIAMAKAAGINIMDPMVQKGIEIEVVENANGRIFELEIELGELEMELVIDSKGNITPKA